MPPPSPPGLTNSEAALVVGIFVGTVLMNMVCCHFCQRCCKEVGILPASSEDLRQRAFNDAIKNLPTHTFGKSGSPNDEEAYSSTTGPGDEEACSDAPEPSPSGPGEATSSSRQDKEEEEEEATCAICLMEFLEGDELRTLPCSHSYHLECIDRWLTHNIEDRIELPSCPLCKAVPIADKRIAKNLRRTRELRNLSMSISPDGLALGPNLGILYPALYPSEDSERSEAPTPRPSSTHTGTPDGNALTLMASPDSNSSQRAHLHGTWASGLLRIVRPCVGLPRDIPETSSNSVAPLPPEPAPMGSARPPEAAPPHPAATEMVVAAGLGQLTV